MAAHDAQWRQARARSFAVFSQAFQASSRASSLKSALGPAHRRPALYLVMAGGSGPLSPKADGADVVASGASRTLRHGLLQVTSSAVAVVAAIIARRFVSAPSNTERTLNL
jgi:hypothetical protein